MPLEKRPPYLADLVHRDHPLEPFPAEVGQPKGTLTKRQRGRDWTRKTPLRGSLLQASSQAVEERAGNSSSLPWRCGLQRFASCFLTAGLLRRSAPRNNNLARWCHCNLIGKCSYVPPTINP